MEQQMVEQKALMLVIKLYFLLLFLIKKEGGVKVSVGREVHCSILSI